tara:strand:+ start:9634 stop:10248 length:615 start_codon:yes stop_codon:yes gene_type:complete
VRFISFDLETTGFLPGVDQITEIGAVRFVDGDVDAVYSTLVNPGKNIPEAAQKVTGISNEMVKDSPKIDDLLPSFADFCGDDLIVAHNAPFDVQFLSADIEKHESPAPKGIVLDTFAIAKKVLPGMANYKLGTLVQHFKIPNSEFHRAEADASYCGKLFLILLKQISSGGSHPAIENLISLSNNKALQFPQVERKPKQLDMFSL